MTADSLCNLLRCAIYVVKRGWKTAMEIQDVGSGASPKGVKRSRRRGGGSSIGLSCGGSAAGETRSALPSLPAGTGFTVNVSLSEALDLSTPGGRALAGMLAAFADDAERDILRDRFRAC
jgi:putative DNA-invertase from lambdoid prophage Rac